MTISLVKIRELAEKYKLLKIALERKDEEYKLSMEPARNELEFLKEKLSESFDKTGLLSIRTEDNTLVSYVKKSGVAITNEAVAFKWAMDNKAIGIDTRIAAQIIKEMKEVPKGFERVESGYIKVTDKKVVKNN